MIMMKWVELFSYPSRGGYLISFALLLGMDVGPWLVFEYMALGDLAQLLRAANGNHLFTGKIKTPHYSLDQVNPFCHILPVRITKQRR